eukprot:3837570-Alexandrium_andersonii.AAC.1
MLHGRRQRSRTRGRQRRVIEADEPCARAAAAQQHGLRPSWPAGASREGGGEPKDGTDDDATGLGVAGGGIEELGRAEGGAIKELEVHRGEADTEELAVLHEAHAPGELDRLGEGQADEVTAARRRRAEEREGEDSGQRAVNDLHVVLATSDGRLQGAGEQNGHDVAAAICGSAGLRAWAASPSCRRARRPTKGAGGTSNAPATPRAANARRAGHSWIRSPS